MSDDLVKILRADDGDWRTDQAADRIEELEVKLGDAIRIGKDWFEQQKKAHTRAVSAEAKLAKAVETEREACANVVRHFYEKGQVTMPEDIINRATIKKLKGQDDE